MIKTILVPATGYDLDRVNFETALGVARLFDAHVDFLHLRIDPIEIYASAMASTEAGGGTAAGEWIGRMEVEAEEQENKTRRTVDDFCKANKLAFDQSGAVGLSSGWYCETGHAADALVEYGREAELMVVGRAGLAPGALVAALFGSGRPLLIPGPSPASMPPETAVIAWKPTREAALAIGAAMPLLERSKRIVVLTVAEAEGEEPDDVSRLVTMLRRHGVETSAQSLPRSKAAPVETLLETATSLSADFLVMGGYGHGRLREMIFGGFTRHVLADGEIPILMAH